MLLFLIKRTLMPCLPVFCQVKGGMKKCTAQGAFPEAAMHTFREKRPQKTRGEKEVPKFFIDKDDRGVARFEHTEDMKNVAKKARGLL